MSVDEPVAVTTHATSSTRPDTTACDDLVGQPLAVIESDPGVFTTLTRKLGIRGLEVVELYDIEPWAVDHLAPRGDFADPAAEKVWFANQLVDDACASQAILNVVLNCPNVDVGDALSEFRSETSGMSPVMKGLAIFNSRLIREAHNSLARPADVRAAFHSATQTTAKANRNKGRPPRSRNKNEARKSPTDSDMEETYHFIGYVPAHGKVWELDGLKSGPLEVGEIPTTDSTSSATDGWMSIARPALRMKMQKYGGDNIKFSLLALVDDQYERASDQLEMCRRKRDALERRLEEIFGVERWKEQLPPQSYSASRDIFTTSLQHDPSACTRVFSPDFSLRSMQFNIRIQELPQRNLIGEWDKCIDEARKARMMAEEEIEKAFSMHREHVKRTHDYEPFIQQFVTCLQNEGMLNALLDQDGHSDTRRKGRNVKKVKKKKA